MKEPLDGDPPIFLFFFTAHFLTLFVNVVSLFQVTVALGLRNEQKKMNEKRGQDLPSEKGAESLLSFSSLALPPTFPHRRTHTLSVHSGGRVHSACSHM